MQIVYATGNNGKFASMQSAGANWGITFIQERLTLPELQSDCLVEIANLKVVTAFQAIGRPVVCLDGGCFITALNGFPGTLTKPVLDKIGVSGILKLMDGETDRRCEMRNCLAYLEPHLSEPVFFQDAVKGTLATERRGISNNYDWSSLFLIFIPEGCTKTLAEMTEEELKAWRHERDKHGSYRSQFFRWLTSR